MYPWFVFVFTGCKLYLHLQFVSCVFIHNLYLLFVFTLCDLCLYLQFVICVSVCICNLYVLCMPLVVCRWLAVVGWWPLAAGDRATMLCLLICTIAHPMRVCCDGIASCMCQCVQDRRVARFAAFAIHMVLGMGWFCIGVLYQFCSVLIDYFDFRYVAMCWVVCMGGLVKTARWVLLLIRVGFVLGFVSVLQCVRDYVDYSIFCNVCWVVCLGGLPNNARWVWLLIWVVFVLAFVSILQRVRLVVVVLRFPYSIGCTRFLHIP